MDSADSSGDDCLSAHFLDCQVDVELEQLSGVSILDAKTTATKVTRVVTLVSKPSFCQVQTTIS